MPQFNENDLTAAVVKSFETTPDKRAKFLVQELVKSLHDYVEKTDLTFEEWEYAIDFLTRTGQKCTPIRQEFILLSDVLGVSMLVDAVNHREREGATQTTVLGPFYVGEHKVMAHGSDVSPHNMTGEKMFVQSRARADLARAFHRRRRCPLLLPHHPAVQLSDSDRWPGRRDDHADQAPSDAACACAFPGQRERTRAADHPFLHRRRQISRLRRRVRREGRSRRQDREAHRSEDARRQGSADALASDDLRFPHEAGRRRRAEADGGAGERA